MFTVSAAHKIETGHPRVLQTAHNAVTSSLILRMHPRVVAEVEFSIGCCRHVHGIVGASLTLAGEVSFNKRFSTAEYCFVSVVTHAMLAVQVAA